MDNILIVVPARGGSKGLPRKNILPFANKPLIVHSINQANKSKYIDIDNLKNKNNPKEISYIIYLENELNTII